jgi:predicted transcriptional regulator
MEEYLQEALEIVKVQAGVRNMTEEEIASMVTSLTQGIKKISEDLEEGAQEPAMEPKKAIKEKSITCLNCGKSFKVLTKKHLALHDLTPDEYREQWGYKKNTPLVCKSLQRQRRRKMKEMKLWERRKQK